MARKTNKTSHVLNLLTGGEASENDNQKTEKQKVPVSSNISIVESQGNSDPVAESIMNNLIEQEEISTEGDAEPKENVKPQAETSAAKLSAGGGKLDQDEIANLIASMNQGGEEKKEPEKKPEPAAEMPVVMPSTGGKLDQDEIANLIASMNQGGEEKKEPEKKPEPAAEKPAVMPSTGGKLDQDEIANLIASMNQGGEEKKEPEKKPEPAAEKPAVMPSTGGKLNQDEIANLIASMNQGGEEKKEPEKKPELAVEKPAVMPSTGGKLDQDEIANLIASMNQSGEEKKEPEKKEAEKKPEPAAEKPAAMPSTGGKLNQDEIANLIAGMQGEKESDISEKAGADREGDPVEAEVPTETPPESPGQPEIEEPDYEYVNVMEYVVHQKLPYYMAYFEMCNCERCKADTKALALTRLPSKYIVIHKNAVNPMLSFYTGKYAAQVTVEVTKACMQIKENPHH